MKYVYANTTTGVQGPDGNIWNLRENDPWDADDPLVKARPGLFSDDPVKVMRTVHAAPVVEQATRAPGERRNTRRG
jgi:hypothetical protein